MRARVWDDHTWSEDKNGNNMIIHVNDCRNLLKYLNGYRGKPARLAVAFFKKKMKELDQ